MYIPFAVLLNDLRLHFCFPAENCTDPPRFSPPRLVVRFGDPVSADCTVCQHACLNNLFGLEKSLGENIINGTRISWRVDRMTEWGTSPLCFYNHDAGQCCSSLPVTVYRKKHTQHAW